MLIKRRKAFSCGIIFLYTTLLFFCLIWSVRCVSLVSSEMFLIICQDLIICQVVMSHYGCHLLPFSLHSFLFLFFGHRFLMLNSLAFSSLTQDSLLFIYLFLFLSQFKNPKPQVITRESKNDAFYANVLNKKDSRNFGNENRHTEVLVPSTQVLKGSIYLHLQNFPNVSLEKNKTLLMVTCSCGMRCGMDGVSLCTENFSTESIIIYIFYPKKKSWKFIIVWIKYRVCLV